jgi:hypothetical protein
VNLDLATIDIWALADDFSPETFLRQLRHILHDGDIIAVGAYSPSRQLCANLTALGATSTDADTIYSVTFDLNRVEHPNGRSFEFPWGDVLLDALVREAERTDGQDDKALFFDHFVAYRRGVPVVPLLCFHDAFFGGTLFLSGLFSEAEIKRFASALPSGYSRQRNPENYPT